MYTFHSRNLSSPSTMYTPPDAQTCYFPILNPAADQIYLNTLQQENYFPTMQTNYFLEQPMPPFTFNQIPYFQSNGQRCLGLPATTSLGPGITIPRRKPTILSADPTLPLMYCKFCLQPFSRRNSLRRHELLHTGIKVYKCYPCSRSFSRQDIFKRHCASRRCQRLTNEATHR
ncbi:hypothetical protein DSO57_1026405 [Entomophthora muscae]|uniref:Uncharacterized protein n=1 Tax=Entomophthora muscae TaxID=34485 RepID=A0ACC2UC74_9FUNG|nr:hypothetical protein DSO57_1026405 [Entomophthora muscae]